MHKVSSLGDYPYWRKKSYCSILTFDYNTVLFYLPLNFLLSYSTKTDETFCLFFSRAQSQPCHWRNAKSVSKRSTDVEVATTPAALSQNINLFQSLRVLQEGENSEDASALSNSEYLYKLYYYYLILLYFTLVYNFQAISINYCFTINA